MNKTTKRTDGSINTSEIIKTYADGLFRLEWSEEHGYALVIQVDESKFFFIEVPTLISFVDDMKEIIRLKGRSK